MSAALSFSIGISCSNLSFPSPGRDATQVLDTCPARVRAVKLFFGRDIWQGMTPCGGGLSVAVGAACRSGRGSSSCWSLRPQLWKVFRAMRDRRKSGCSTSTCSRIVCKRVFYAHRFESLHGQVLPVPYGNSSLYSSLGLRNLALAGTKTSRSLATYLTAFAQ